ncbi:hypothetical protein ACYZT4_17330 [Pseudomonas sp. GB2N2]
MPVDKAISWPLSQENFKFPPVEVLGTRFGDFSVLQWAPDQGVAPDQAPVLRIGNCSKNEQLTASHAGHGAAKVINGLSTDCSTVFVRKLEARA